MLSTVSASNLNNGMVSYYKLDENAANTTVADSHGTNTGTASTNTANLYDASGKINSAYDFDGSNDYIHLTDLNPNFNSITLNAWIKTSGESNGIIIGSQVGGPSNDLLLVVMDNLVIGRRQVSYGNDDVTWATSIADSDWHMITLTIDSTDGMILYVDGDSKDTNPYVSSATRQNWEIGSYNDGSDAFFDGLIDEVGIWNRTLNSIEINELYNSGDGLNYPGVSVYITLKSPINQSILSNQSINFITLSNNIPTLNCEWKNISYYIWNSTGLFNQTFIDIVDGVTFNNTLLINDFSIGNYEWNVYGCYGNTTFNNCTFSDSNFTFEWRPFEIVSQSYNSYIYETETQRFNLTINTLPEVLNVDTKLNYNGTLYPATTSCVSGVCNIYSIIDIPLITSGESENRTVFWNITIYDGTNSYSFDTEDESYEQNTTRIHLEECAGVYTTPTVNFTAYYETNLTRINPFYIAGTFDNWLGSGNIYRTSSFNEASIADLKLCITPTDRTQYSNAHIEYKFDNENITFIPRNYFFQNKTLTNVSEEINLFLLEAEDSTSFIIKVQDQKLSPVAEALVYIQKYYPSDGEYRTVQIAKTDSNGETLGFYETETTDYKHTIIKNGVILLETAQQKVVGKSVPFTLTFTIGQALGYPWNSFEDNINVDTNLTFDKDNNIVTFNYIENTTGYVTSGQLLVFQNSLTNSTSMIVCNVSSSEASATLTCDLTGYDGTFTAVTYINGEAQNILEFIITDAREIFGDDGLFLGMMIILVAGFAMMWNPSAGIISINAVVIFVNMIGFISVSPIFIFGMISISIITIILLKT